ncbi:hypothetical protein QQ045_020073 [Rhodiola kirilowii]
MRRASSTSLLLLPAILVFLCFLDFTFADQKTWCVAKPSSDEATLLENINFACAHVDCSVMHKGCPCNSPDSLMNHASIAMNLYYQCKGRNHWNCHFGNSAIIVITNPSYGGCTYES